MDEYNAFYSDEEFEAIMDYVYQSKHDHLIYRPFSNEMFRNQNKL
jgi:hypothetical protein